MAKILLVDDEVHLLKAMDMFLRSRKHDVMPISDGREAERLIRSSPYDLIISDIRMTPVDGLQLLRISADEPAIHHDARDGGRCCQSISAEHSVPLSLWEHRYL
ncbi:MAG: response regulator, partial [Verrucomicrobia bacterium]|nr:response regulator [Verrucomicrobiota bacterium]